MPHNPKVTASIRGYVDLPDHRRMKRIQRARPRLTVSRQIAECIKAHLPALEAAAGLKPKSD